MTLGCLLRNSSRLPILDLGNMDESTVWPSLHTTRCRKQGRSRFTKVAVLSQDVNSLLSAHRLADCVGFNSVG